MSALKFQGSCHVKWTMCRVGPRPRALWRLLSLAELGLPTEYAMLRSAERLNCRRRLPRMRAEWTRSQLGGPAPKSAAAECRPQIRRRADACFPDPEAPKRGCWVETTESERADSDHTMLVFWWRNGLYSLEVSEWFGPGWPRTRDDGIQDMFKMDVTAVSCLRLIVYSVPQPSLIVHLITSS